MKGATLKSRAIVFALCAGAIAFVLALLATSHGHVAIDNIALAFIPAVVCAAMCWASAERIVSTTAAAIDAAIARLARAAHGDLEGGVPDEVRRVVPQLAGAMDRLFEQLHLNLESIQRLAMFDQVTGLPNRLHFRRSCDRILAEMPSGRLGALLFIDLDRFKAVNDTMGHACGDILLGMVSNRLRAVGERAMAEGMLETALIGRLSGDEFTIFLNGLRTIADAERVGRSVLFALAEPFDITGSDVSVGASIGIALRPEHGETLTELMRAADAAMYHAKESGRGRTEHFSAALAARLADRAQLESDLRKAVAAHQFTLVFQPQLSLPDSRIVAAEALLRWRHPEDGVRLPGSFIARAEETGIIVEIGEWVVAEVARTIARWARQGIQQRLAVNVSPRQIDHAGFFRQLRAALRDAGAPAPLLELEISETLAMQCSDEVVAAIAELRADGATIAIDDFGTGYTNLPRLRALPVDRIKLDRSLIVDIVEDAGARAIAQAVVGLIHGLDCEAVGEGIESRAQAEMLRIIGCDTIQGYAIAEPMDEDAFIAWTGNGAVRLAG